MSNSIDNLLKFDEVTLENYIEIRRTLFKTFIESQFKYHPHVWMFHGRQRIHKINRLHESYLRICIMAMSQLFRTFYVKIINIQFIFQTFSLPPKNSWRTLYAETRQLFCPFKTKINNSKSKHNLERKIFYCYCKEFNSKWHQKYRIIQ